MTQLAERPVLAFDVPREVETARTMFYCVECKRCNAGLSGEFTAARVFVHCKKCGKVTEAKRD